MLKNRYINVFLVAAIIILGAAGLFYLQRSPAPKPVPEERVSPPLPAPIPGAPEFDALKYQQEPVITVWLADKQYTVQMPLEKYLEGVVAKEMENDWPLEALRAQAVASRTLTVSAIEAGTIRRLHNADVSTDKEELQAYAPEKVNDNVRVAVQSTRGDVLLYDSSLVYAIYSASNGQIAAVKEESFPEEIPFPTPYFQPVTDDSFRYTPANLRSWTVSIPADEVAAAVGYKGNPADIAILEKGPSGRILYIGAGDKKIYGAKFRKLIGFDRLKSTLVNEMTYKDGRFIFQGSGWGNGLGLCQWGAYTYAMEGRSAEDILKYYYVGAQIAKLWQ